MGRVAESAAFGRSPWCALAGEPDLMGGVKLDDPSILDNEGDRAVAHSVQKPRQFGHERFQIVALGRVQTCQGAPPAGVAAGISR